MSSESDAKARPRLQRLRRLLALILLLCIAVGYAGSMLQLQHAEDAAAASETIDAEMRAARERAAEPAKAQASAATNNQYASNAFESAFNRSGGSLISKLRGDKKRQIEQGASRGLFHVEKTWQPAVEEALRVLEGRVEAQAAAHPHASHDDDAGGAA